LQLKSPASACLLAASHPHTCLRLPAPHRLAPARSTGTMAPPSGQFARRGGKVLNSQRSQPSPTSQRKGVGLGKGIAQRHRYRVRKDTILGITKPDIRRLARRGGVKRISAGVYDTARHYLRDFLREVGSALFAWDLIVGVTRLCRLRGTRKEKNSSRHRRNLCPSKEGETYLRIRFRKSKFLAEVDSGCLG